MLEGDLFCRHFEVFGRAPLGFSSSKDNRLSFDSVESIRVVFESIPAFFSLLFILDFSLSEDPRSFEKLLEILDNILTFFPFSLNGVLRPLTSSSSFPGLMGSSSWALSRFAAADSDLLSWGDGGSARGGGSSGVSIFVLLLS